MKASEAITKLQELIKEHGDLPMLTVSDDSYFGEYEIAVEVRYKLANTGGNYGSSYLDGFVVG